MRLYEKFSGSFIHPLIHTNKHGISAMCKVLCSNEVIFLKAQAKDGRTHIFEKYILKNFFEWLRFIRIFTEKLLNELRHSKEMGSKIMFQGNRNKKQNVILLGADGIMLFNRC